MTPEEIIHQRFKNLHRWLIVMTILVIMEFFISRWFEYRISKLEHKFAYEMFQLDLNTEARLQKFEHPTTQPTGAKP